MNNIILGDAFKVLPTLDSDSVDLIVFSPPYDNIRDYNGFPILDKNGRLKLGEELLRVAKDGSVCAVVIQDETVSGAKSGTSHRWVAEWLDMGWKLFETCIYARDGRPGVWWNRRFRVDHEYILIFFKGDKVSKFDKESLKIKAKHAGKMWHGTQRQTNGKTVKIEPKKQADTKCPGTIWHYKTSNCEGNVLKSVHPATMPDDLARDLIQCFSVPGDLVLDPMAGSGTTCVMAAKWKRKYIGIELSQKYHSIIKDRLNNEIDIDIFGDEIDGK